VKKHLVDRIPFSKIATVLAVSLIISLGLCGVGLTADNQPSSARLLARILHLALSVGLIAFWVSLLGLTLLIILFIVLITFRDMGNSG
jgi:hypothetical protein